MTIHNDISNDFFIFDINLGLSYTIIDNDNKYYYEFEIISIYDAKLRHSNNIFINEVIDKFRINNKNIHKIYDNNNILLAEFNSLYIFKLPINIIQPTEMFINNEKYTYLDSINPELICFAVSIVNDEYILLNKHEELLFLKKCYFKMVNVYMDKHNIFNEKMIYILKESNIKSISDLKLLNNDEFLEYKKQQELIKNIYK